ncbi:unnamed protein product [Paramecium primaurelia]|uniref:Ubiquitin-like domain-containing protein n=1 Tax=Paramecium primaurelia TaxID=5886 RepID=A0A8S1PNL8_PARPR|nr:unnamed protein product [Paramecium primaurelia]
MKKYELIVNNGLFKFEYEPKSHSANINDVIQFINQQIGFPAKSQLYIIVDNNIRDTKFDLKDAKNNIIHIKFSDIIETFTIQHINKDEKYKLVLEKVDTCQQLIEIEKKIANLIKCEEYPIKILKKNQFFDRNLLLCQIFIYQQEIYYHVLAMFIIQYKDKRQLFQIDAFSHFDKIKQKIRQKFGIDEEIELYFRGRLLEEQQTYQSYKIHQNAELELRVKNMQKIQILYQEKIYEFNLSVNLTIEDIIKYNKQFDSIHQNQVLQIHYNNKCLENNIRIGDLDLSNDILFIMTNKIQEKFLLIKFVNKEQQQQNYQFRVSNLEYFSIIYDKYPFKGKIFEFYVNDIKLAINDKLIFNDIQFKDDNNYLIEYQLILNYQIINVTFEDEEGNLLKLQVKSEDIINDEIQKNLNNENARIKAYKKGQLIDLNGTYKSEEIQDGDIINYYFAEITIQFMIWFRDQLQIQEINVNYLDRIKDLKEKIINQHKITDECKILLDGDILNDDVCLKNFKKNTIFRISKIFHFKIELLLDNNIEQSECRFYETDKISQIKYQYREIFWDEVCIQVDNKEDLDDNDELSDYINKVLRISKKNINVRYKFDGNQIVYQDKYSKLITLGEMLKIIANRQSRCYICNNLMDENIKLDDLNLDQNTEITIQCTSRAQFIEFNNNLNKFEIDFYPEDIIGQAIKNHIKGKFIIQQDNKELNLQKSFQSENIQNGAELIYIFLVTIKFKDFETKELLFSQTYKVNMKISQILNQKNFNKAKVYYLEKEINQDKTLAELGIIDYSELNIEVLENILILHLDDKITKIIIDSNITIQTLKQQQNLNNEIYQIYAIHDQTQVLSNDIILKTLLNENNEIELIFKMNNSYIQIHLIDNEDRQYTENVQLNQQVKTFINELKIKYNLDENPQIFYEGEILDQEQYFSELQITKDTLFEIII